MQKTKHKQKNSKENFIFALLSQKLEIEIHINLFINQKIIIYSWTAPDKTY